ncbi:Pleiotropic drug resistance protein 2 [Glycine max]|nr:pleiotropic drug resistance protein 2-like isoform X1 [Glycine soja]KAH1191528.1 Pleiotropic drug resistance protein 2 [Glycine max]KAH1191529.1 Pleiotropic drug resistance protein 2 [Glycine max]KHN00911.1 Pleiotropic drug resistance protein 2 [Glycine soja]
MEEGVDADEVVRSVSSLRMSIGSMSRRSWVSASVSEMWGAGHGGDVFERSTRVDDGDNDEEELMWAAIERLPTFERLRKSIVKRALEESGRFNYEEVDISNLGFQDKKKLLHAILRKVEVDNETFLRRIRERIDRVAIEIPKVEVRFEHLFVEGDAFNGTRALPTLVNSTMNAIERILGSINLLPSKRSVIKILQDVSGIVKPARLTLLLGPPRSGKTTLLQALAGKLDRDLRVSGRVTYCGHELSEFVPQRTCAYISQHNLHHGEMTVRETLDFSGRCLGVGTRHELLLELIKREKQSGLKPDPEIDAFMKATAVEGQETSLITDYVLKVLGLEICADTLVGDEMRRGISGGEKKRLTTGEMLVGPAKVFLMDEISTGLDSSTTFQIVKFLRQLVHVMDVTMIISLLQPAPETYDLFDDIILLSEGHIIYQGPRENVLNFFESVGFKCPERKGVADFLQEVTSRKEQEQYWFARDKPYRYVSVPEFVAHFNNFGIGQQLSQDLQVPYDRAETHPAALVKDKYGISKLELFKACFAREWLLMKRSAFVYIFKTTQIMIMSLITMTVFFRTEMRSGHLEDGRKYYGALFFSLTNIMFNGMAELSLTIFRLPVFFKQRDSLFFPAWAFAIPIWIFRIPLSFVESGLWVVLTYYTVGYAPAPSRFFRQLLAFFCSHQMGMSLFRFIAALGRTLVVANTFGFFVLLLVYVLGGFIIAKDNLEPWMKWGYYISPMMYGQNAIAINEFLDERWSAPNTDHRIPEPTVGKALLRIRSMFTEDYWYWISIGALLGFSLLFNICFIIALTFLNPYGDSKSIILEEENEKKGTTEDSSASTDKSFENADIDMAEKNTRESSIPKAGTATTKRGMVLPFKPLSLAFDHVNYYVNMPTEMEKHGVEGSRLQLLRDVSGAFRPGVLTALVGVTGAGKTTLMDVLAGRKTGGYIEGSISISGYPKKQATFARISGYCEQNDIHSPRITVYESILFSAWLRLGKEVKREIKKMFVEEVMNLVELHPVRDFQVGLPGIDGLSTEQRKRLTIAVELVANPSIIFMDEPTSGLDARAAAIVMRAVRNTADTGRTIVCTIHQPSIDIFESFDELLLMKRGGQIIYNGPLGQQSQNLIAHFEAFPEVPRIKDGYNPATWVLEISTPAVESQLRVDFAEFYTKSELYQRNQELIKELSTPLEGTKDLDFPTKYSLSFITQCIACFWKQHLSYWRNPQYNGIRLFMAISIGVIFGLIFWKKGNQTDTEQDLMNLMGAIFAAVFFLGGSNTSTVQPIVAIERTVFYRERAAGMYSALPYAIAQVAIECIYVAIQTFTFSLILFSMMGFLWRVDKFLWFYFFMFISFVYFTLYGMMTAALTPNPQIAAIVMAFFLVFWNVFSGFIIPKSQIPIWWRWFYWVCPTAWSVYGLVTSQVGDKDTPILVPGSEPMTVKAFLEEEFGYEYGFLGVVAVAHIAFVALFLFVFAYGIKVFNFQKR